MTVLPRLLFISLLTLQAQAQSPVPDEWTQLEQQAAEHYRGGDYVAALEIAQQTVALAEREQGVGAGAARLASSLNMLALVHQAQGNYSEAQPLLERAVAIAADALPADHPNIAALRENLAAVEQAQRDQALATLMGKAQHLNEQALALHERGEYEAAEALYLQVLPIIDSHFGSQSMEVARVQGSLADTYAARKRYEQAEAAYQKMLVTLEQHSDERVAHSGALNALGVIHYVQRQYGKAQPLFERSLELMEAEHGVEHESLLPMLDNLATLYRATNRRTDAEPLLRRAAAIRKAQKVAASVPVKRTR